MSGKFSIIVCLSSFLPPIHDIKLSIVNLSPFYINIEIKLLE
nr:MAG TPA: hypothetical protein [Bacteriophage sp.]